VPSARYFLIAARGCGQRLPGRGNNPGILGGIGFSRCRNNAGLPRGRAGQRDRAQAKAYATQNAQSKKYVALARVPSLQCYAERIKTIE
jgi:hypothetical protein